MRTRHLLPCRSTRAGCSEAGNPNKQMVMNMQGMLVNMKGRGGRAQEGGMLPGFEIFPQERGRSIGAARGGGSASEIASPSVGTEAGSPDAVRGVSGAGSLLAIENGENGGATQARAGGAAIPHAGQRAAATASVQANIDRLRELVRKNKTKEGDGDGDSSDEEGADMPMKKRRRGKAKAKDATKMPAAAPAVKRPAAAPAQRATPAKVRKCSSGDVYDSLKFPGTEPRRPLVYGGSKVYFGTKPAFWLMRKATDRVDVQFPYQACTPEAAWAKCKAELKRLNP